MLWAYGCLAPLLLFGLHLTQRYPQPFVEHISYNAIIFTMLGIILSFVTVVHIFYLGKFHDYSREIIKIHSSMKESLGKTKVSLLRSSVLREEFAKMIKEKSNEDVSEFQQALSAIQTKRKHLEETLQTLEPEISEKAEDINKHSIKSPGKIAVTLLIVIAMVMIGFVTYYQKGDIVTIGDLYFLLVSTLGSIINFVYIWYLFENRLLVLGEHIRSCSDITTKLNIESNMADFESQSYERMLNHQRN